MEHKPLLMVTDDDNDDLFLFEEALKVVDPAIDLITASDGRDALEKLRNMNPRLPDILFLDINMNGMNGWDCLQHLKADENIKHVPVIIYSTSNHQSDIDKALYLKALCFCTKPDDFKDLVNLLDIITKNISNDLEAALRACKECKTIYFQ